jgi:hypothetical protein
MLADAQALPALAGVGAGKDFAGGAGQHRLGLGRPDRHIVDVGIVQPAGDAGPGLSTVEAPAHAIHLDARPHDVMIRGVNGQGGHPRDAHVGALLGHLNRELLPMLSTVTGAKERRGAGAGEDDVRIRRVEGDLPDVQRVHGGVQSLKARSLIPAAVDPVISASIDNLWLFGMDG